jgi:hypothetical protein
MSDLLEYKGYFGSLRFSDEDRVLHGKIVHQTCFPRSG